ncbi:AbrB family transcriptional regulator [Jatrophihabitans sp. GAS493]|uniref:AbrB/MazE/SpoVT family DNA-binding domain-containing protein n=1 Tax=Jatrophihabitans sp. GAS493 TaxID=1907575 RepID=UPI000BB8C656|nr:AbrB/MazE/SpoVT family DNA-binding domain-containing protein [Jatrophihabitans sp. GAS493]SOD72543.1 AbrB family transcriptional regulator [Jatrophihabitans sp. GAS493]
MRVTSKGQVTIPLDIRRRLGVEPGSEVDFVVDDEVVRVVRRAEGGGAALVNRMRGRRLSMTTDEIMALTRGED